MIQNYTIKCNSYEKVCHPFIHSSQCTLLDFSEMHSSLCNGCRNVSDTVSTIQKVKQDCFTLFFD